MDGGEVAALCDHALALAALDWEYSGTAPRTHRPTSPELAEEAVDELVEYARRDGIPLGAACELFECSLAKENWPAYRVAVRAFGLLVAATETARKHNTGGRRNG
jgi:hypothetical protein